MFSKQFALRISVGMALAALACLGICLSTAWAKEKYGRLHDQMEKVHEGRKSPLRQTQSELAKDAPAWDVVDKQLPPFKSMSEALSKSKHDDIKDSASGYADAITALETATKKRDLAESRSALKLLTNSCADCHFKDGPGGLLEKDHEKEREHDHKEKGGRHRD